MVDALALPESCVVANSAAPNDAMLWVVERSEEVVGFSAPLTEADEIAFRRNGRKAATGAVIEDVLLRRRRRRWLESVA